MVGLTLGCTLGIHRCRGVLWDHWSMTGGRVCYAREGTAGTADGDHWVIDARASLWARGGKVEFD